MQEKRAFNKRKNLVSAKTQGFKRKDGKMKESVNYRNCSTDNLLCKEKRIKVDGFEVKSNRKNQNQAIRAIYLLRSEWLSRFPS